MEQKICLDTNILVDFLRNKPQAIRYILEKEKKATLTTTTINVFELYFGAYKSSQSEHNVLLVDELIERLDSYTLTHKAAKFAASEHARLEKKGKQTQIRDLFIGAIAKTNNCSIKTNNKKDFSNITDLEIA